jgi:hypothetical protein
MEEAYLALIVGFLFFICKVILNKFQKEETGQKDFRDSFLVAVLVGSVLMIKKTNFASLSEKVKVFVNEPGF